MNKVTYLFGAGASCNALPIVNEIPGRIDKLITKLSDPSLKLSAEEYFKDPKLKNPKQYYQNSLLGDLKWLLEASKCHASVDTFAKKLFIKNDYENLKRLKVALSAFFTLEQIINSPDSRYDAFYASLLSKSYYDFPDNVRILSWNYDIQFEIAFSAYTEIENLESNRGFLGIRWKHTKNNFDNKFSIYKLNGTCAYHSTYNGHSIDFIDNLNETLNIHTIQTIVERYAVALNYNGAECSLSFAWEPDSSFSTLFPNVIEQIRDTCALVVIGYSFPYFNRETDRQIIGSMSNLKKVYFQAPDAENLKERFQAIRDDLTGIQLVTKVDTLQFLLPNEL